MPAGGRFEPNPNRSGIRIIGYFGAEPLLLTKILLHAKFAVRAEAHQL